jgi:hypothetical protein
MQRSSFLRVEHVIYLTYSLPSNFFCFSQPKPCWCFYSSFDCLCFSLSTCVILFFFSFFIHSFYRHIVILRTDANNNARTEISCDIVHFLNKQVLVFSLSLTVLHTHTHRRLSCDDVFDNVFVVFLSFK